MSPSFSLRRLRSAVMRCSTGSTGWEARRSPGAGSEIVIPRNANLSSPSVYSLSNSCSAACDDKRRCFSDSYCIATFREKTYGTQITSFKSGDRYIKSSQGVTQGDSRLDLPQLYSLVSGGGVERKGRVTSFLPLASLSAVSLAVRVVFSTATVMLW